MIRKAGEGGGKRDKKEGAGPSTWTPHQCKLCLLRNGVLLPLPPLQLQVTGTACQLGTQQDNKGFIMFEGTMAIHGTSESECIDFNQLKSLTDILRRNTFKN